MEFLKFENDFIRNFMSVMIQLMRAVNTRGSKVDDCSKNSRKEKIE